MPEYKNFQLDFKEGSIAVSFLIDFTGSEVQISNLYVHTSQFNSNIGKHPEFVKDDNGKFHLRNIYFAEMSNDTEKKMFEIVDNEYSQCVIERISEIIKEASKT